MSLTRLLLYSNEIRIEGLVATTSTWQPDKIRPDIMRQVVQHYGEVHANLSKHDSRFPDESHLKSLIAPGQDGYGLENVGSGKSSQGARALIRAIESKDAQPLHIALWGGANTLAQALWQLQETHSKGEMDRLIAGLRVYSISDQDDAGPWIRQRFPELSYIVDPSAANAESYAQATWTGISGDRYDRNAPGADFHTVTNEWLEKHIRSKGPLGRAYPRYKFIMEGDTPSFLNLVRNGLDSEMSPGWGGWGGRYIRRQPLSESRPIWTSGGDFYPGRPNGADTVTGEDGKSYTSNQATIWRWRNAYQNDFAARMDWTVSDYAHANHEPQAIVNGDTTQKPIRIKAKAGETVHLDASMSKDPDNDNLDYHWFVYPEAGSADSDTAPKELISGYGSAEGPSVPPIARVMNGEADAADIKANRSGTTHIILAITDEGSPRLTSYRRIILKVSDSEAT